MALKLRTYAYWSERKRGEGLRLGCTRYLVRGVFKADYARANIMDVWMPLLAPSRILLDWRKLKDLEDPKHWATFLARYEREMKKTDARQTIVALARLARSTPISVGCYCQGDACHRFTLERLIRTASRENG